MNKDKQSPRFEPNKKAAIKKSVFFNKSDINTYKFRTYFAPGQHPNVTKNYYPPTGWPVPKSALRVPEVVWITLGFLSVNRPGFRYFVQGPAIYGEWSSIRSEVLNEEARTITKVVSSYWSDGHVHTVTIVSTFGGIILFTSEAPDPPYVTYTTEGTVTIIDYNSGIDPQPNFDVIVDNPFYVEYQRILPQAQSAIDTINQIRPNRTWAQLNDYSAEFPQLLQIPAELAIDGQSHLIVPSGGNFFGTKFLHIHIGIPFDERFGALTNHIFDPDYTFLISGSTGGSNYNIVYSFNPDPVKFVYDLFAGFSVKLFGPAGNMSGPGVPARQSSVPFPTGGIESGTESLLRVDNLDNQHIIDYYTEFTAEVETEMQDFRDDLAEQADELKDYGYSYEGDSSLITSDFLVSLIAHHFKFDPHTGENIYV